MQLPEPIQSYFEADRQGDDAGLARAFATDALVKDEGAAYRGLEAIGAWWRATKAQYDHKAEPFDAIATEDGTYVQAMVSGKFPGSPATLTYRFRLAGDRIAELEIGA